MSLGVVWVGTQCMVHSVWMWAFIILIRVGHRTGELFEDAEREQRELGAKSKLHLIILDEVHF